MTGADTVRVLVVDDDFAVASVHRGYVESVPGLEVVGEVHRGLEALQAVQVLAPDLVLLDIHLPDLSGVEVLRRLRSLAGPQPDVIVITAAREVETVRAAMTTGVVDYLVKPFSLGAFRERLEAYRAHRAELLRRTAEPGRGLQQSDVDRLFSTRRRVSEPLAATPLPKGLSPRTLEFVARTLASSPADDLSAGEVGQRCGLARVSARRYLEHLERTGLAAVRPRYGAAGRPENGYRWTG
ncbi:response regulator [Modestobacter marinus]|uniref:Transcriptional regulatory protein n=1 Tax=Modestobacter marinus TaxID=477641 RepID=A0A846LES8_9ACTN|nr:response regulator [Modestobacter marinus]NIH65711.1 two-component system CitB family response regulator [Modestobacter marinus]GGL66460.1 transcriptional regulatory protein [Modestobacter marinus]